MTLHEKALQIRAAQEEQELKQKQEHLAKVKEHLEDVEQEFRACFAQHLPLLEQHGIKWSAHLNSPHYHYIHNGSYIEFEMDGKCLKMDFRDKNNYQYKYTGYYELDASDRLSTTKEGFILFLDEFFFSEKPEPVAEHKEEVMRQEEPEEEMKTAIARTNHSFDVWCPCCEELVDITDELYEAEVMTDNRFRAEGINEKIICPECGKTFIVTDVEY